MNGTQEIFCKERPNGHRKDERVDRDGRGEVLQVPRVGGGEWTAVRQDRGECDAQGVLQNHVIGKKDPVVAEGVPEALGDHLVGEQTHVIGQPHVLPDARRALIQGQAHRVQHGISHENHIKSQRGKHVAHPVDTAGLDAFAAAEGLDPPV